MATLILNANTAAPINLVVQRINKGSPRMVGSVTTSENGANRSSVRGQAKNIPVITSWVDIATEAAIQAAAMNGAYVPCSGDILANIQTICTIDGIVSTVVPATSPMLYEVSFTLNEVNASTVLLKYAAGDTITGEIFTRTTIGYQQDSVGTYVQKAINAKRDGHYVSGLRSILLEDARTNSALRSNDLTNAGAWGGSGTGSAVQNAVGLDGSANSATTLTDSDAAAFYNKFQTITVTNNSSSTAVTIWIRKDAVSSRFVGINVALSGGTGVSRSLNLNTQTGALGTYSASVGGGSHRVYDAVLWWAVEVVVINNTTGNGSLQVTIYPAVGSVFGTVAVATTGSCVVGQVNIERDSSFGSSPIFTTSATVTRGADSYSLPFTTPPMETTAYVKFVELGSILATGRLFGINAAGSPAPQFLCYANGGFYTGYHNNNDPGYPAVAAAVGPASSLNDSVETLTRLFGDGSVDCTQSIGGAASTTSGQSGVAPLASAWSGALVWLNSSGTPGVQVGFGAYRSFKLVAGERSLTEMRAA